MDKVQGFICFWFLLCVAVVCAQIYLAIEDDKRLAVEETLCELSQGVRVDGVCIDKRAVIQLPELQESK